GSATAGAGNVISGNDHLNNSAGVTVGPGGFNTTIQGNLIGTNAAGNAAVANRHGIAVGGPLSPTATLIGGTSATARNVIAGNAFIGIAFDGSGGAITGGTVIGNYIGLNAAGNAA